jgi:sodium/bile acid cotransporter 7
MRFLDPMVRLILAAVVLATVFPVTGETRHIAQGVSNAEVFAGLGNHRLLVTLVLWVFGAMTLVGAGLWQVSGTFIPPLLAIGFLYLGVLPSTVQSATAYSSLAGGNVASSVIAAALINILGVFISAPLFSLLAGSKGSVFHGDQLIKVMTMLLLPFVIGQVLQGFTRHWVSGHKGLITIMDRGSIGISVYVAFSSAVEQGIWTKVDGLAWLVVLAGCAVAMVFGYGGAWVVGGIVRLPHGDRIAMLFAGGQKSVAMGAPLATVLFPAASAGVIIVPLVVYHLVQMIVAAPLATRLRAHSAPG